MSKLTTADVETLLGYRYDHGLPAPFSEETDRSWLQRPTNGRHGTLHQSKVYLELEDRPLLRLWDLNSRSRPDKVTGFIEAENKRCQLLDRQTRRRMLSSHVDNKNWEAPTPFISFTTSPEEIARIALAREHRPGQQLTVIDPRPRLTHHLPILNCLDELLYYGIDDPYENGHKYYMKEYLCLWQVNEDEVVGTWSWDELSKNPKWYEAVVLPHWQRFRANGKSANS